MLAEVTLSLQSPFIVLITAPPFIGTKLCGRYRSPTLNSAFFFFGSAFYCHKALKRRLESTGEG